MLGHLRNQRSSLYTSMVPKRNSRATQPLKKVIWTERSPPQMSWGGLSCGKIVDYLRLVLLETERVRGGGGLSIFHFDSDCPQRRRRTLQEHVLPLLCMCFSATLRTLSVGNFFLLDLDGFFGLIDKRDNADTICKGVCDSL
jgi:hypothetical protein